VRPDVPGGVLAVLRMMVEKDPNRRFNTPDAVAKALRPFCCPEARLLGLLDRGDLPPPAPPPLPWYARGAVRLAMLAAALLLTATAIVGFILRARS
jgi:hypothetical protein